MKSHPTLPIPPQVPILAAILVSAVAVGVAFALYAALASLALLAICGLAFGIWAYTSRSAWTRASAAEHAIVEPAAQLTFLTVRLLPAFVALRVHLPIVSIVTLVVLSSLSAWLVLSRRQAQFQMPALLSVMLLGLAAISWMVAWRVTGTFVFGHVVLCAMFAVAVILLALAVVNVSENHGTLVYSAVLDSVAIYLIANVVGYFILGIRSPIDAYFSETGPVASSGLFDRRVVFPFSTGLTISPAMAATFVAGVVPVLNVSLKRRDILRLGGLTSAVIMILAAEGRGAMLMGLCIALLALLLPRLLVLVGPYLAIAFLCLPLWWGTVNQIIGPVLGWALQSFARSSGGQEFFTLQNRTDVWDVIFRHALTADTAKVVFGYGARGQIPSGVAQEYLGAVGNYFQNREIFPSAHNSVLQQGLESGIVGALLLLLVVGDAGLSLQRSLRRRISNWSSVEASRMSLLVMLIVLAGTGSLEQTLATGSITETFWLFIFITLIATPGASDSEIILDTTVEKRFAPSTLRRRGRAAADALGTPP